MEGTVTSGFSMALASRTLSRRATERCLEGTTKFRDIRVDIAVLRRRGAMHMTNHNTIFYIVPGPPLDLLCPHAAY